MNDKCNPCCFTRSGHILHLNRSLGASASVFVDSKLDTKNGLMAHLYFIILYNHINVTCHVYRVPLYKKLQANNLLVEPLGRFTIFYHIHSGRNEVFL